MKQGETMKTKTILALMMLMLLVSLNWAYEIEIGSHGGGAGDNNPFQTRPSYGRHATLYRAAEIGMFGNITDLSWEEAAFTAPLSCPVKIYLKMTTATTMPQTTWSDMITGAILVFDGVQDFSTLGWKTFDTMDYMYTSNNLLVLIEANFGGDGGGFDPYFRYHETPNSAQYWFSNGTPPLGLGNLYAVRPDIRMYIIDPNPPLAAVNPVPATAATNVFLNPALTWESGGGTAPPTGYRLYLGTNTPPGNIVNGTDLGLVNSYNPSPNLLPNQTYYWKIVPYNPNGSTSGCPVWSFTTGGRNIINTFPWNYGFETTYLPDNEWTHSIVQGTAGFNLATEGWSSEIPTTPHSGSEMISYDCRDIASGDNAILATPSIHMTDTTMDCQVSFWLFKNGNWESSNDKLQVYVNSSPNLTGAALIGEVSRSLYFAPLNMPEGWGKFTFNMGPGSSTDKYLILRGVSDNGLALLIDDLEISKVTHHVTPLSAANPTPENLARGIDYNVTLGWSPGSAGTAIDGYYLSFGTDNPPTNILSNEVLSNINSYDVPIEYNNFTTYYWQVIPFNASGSATGNTVWSFTTLLGHQDEAGTCLNLNGTDQYVNLGNDSRFDLGNSLTLEAWIKPASLSQRMAVFSTRQTDVAGSFQLEVGPGSGGTNRVAVSGFTGWVAQTADNAIVPGSWNHITYTRTGAGSGQQKIYVNGAEIPLITDAAYTFINNTNPKAIGAGISSGQLFNGAIEEVSLYNQEVTAYAIRVFMYSSDGFNNPGMVACWQFNEGSGAFTEDSMTFKNGALVNVLPTEWITSTLSYGDVYHETQTEADVVNLYNPGVFMEYSSYGAASLTAHQFQFAPNVYPTDPVTPFQNSYWAVHRYGTVSFNANLGFYINGLKNFNFVDPGTVQLYTRLYGSDGGWTFVRNAYFVDTNSGNVWFNNISSYGQYLVTYSLPASMDTPQNVAARTINGYVRVEWDYVPAAQSYKIFASDTPDGVYTDVSAWGYFDAEWGGGRGTGNGLSSASMNHQNTQSGTRWGERQYWYQYIDESTPPIKFYKVIASSDG